MGLNRHSLNIILNLEDYGITGVDFNKIMTIGRQGLHESKRSIDELLKPMDLTISDYDYCEDLFFKLNAEVIDSIDFSNYENASIIHDMNSSIPKDLHAFYDLVIDAGSLEHVFNFPVALKNCMEMVKVGGHFIGVFPIDNFCGHGFYQFSPELFFRCFSQENGFKSLKMFLYQEKPKLNLFEIIDPQKLKRRNNFYTSNKTMAFFVSKKINKKNIFKTPPQQSDYVIRWDNNDLEQKVFISKKNIFKMIKKVIPSLIKDIIKKILNGIYLLKRGIGLYDSEGLKRIQ